ncbi:MAG: cupin domain-containing protein [Gammaproteobacteria bacterium]
MTRFSPLFLAAVLVASAADAADAVSGAAATPLLEIVRITSNPAGETRFETGAILLDEQDYAPPAPAVAVSQRLPASDIAFASLPPGYFGDWHPAPRRQYGLILAGTLEIETGDGARRTFGAGEVFLLEDTAGQGHRTWVKGDTPALLGLVPVAPGAPQTAGSGAPTPRR